MVHLPTVNKQKEDCKKYLDKIKKEFETGYAVFPGNGKWQYFITEGAFLEAHPNFYEPIFGTKPLRVDLEAPIENTRQRSCLDELFEKEEGIIFGPGSRIEGEPLDPSSKMPTLPEDTFKPKNELIKPNPETTKYLENLREYQKKSEKSTMTFG